MPPPSDFKEKPLLRLKYRLALRLGRTVAELAQVLTVREFTYWLAYQRLALEEHAEAAAKGFHDPTFWD